MLVASIIYKRIHGIKYEKYEAGNAINPRISPSFVNGIIVNIPIPSVVIAVSDVEALLCINGILGVLICLLYTSDAADE